MIFVDRSFHLDPFTTYFKTYFRLFVTVFVLSIGTN